MSLVHERDYEVRYDTTVTGEFLAGTGIEIVREPAARGQYQHALFDFDGTLSLIREGWPEIMAPMMVEALMNTPNHEAQSEIEWFVRDLIIRTTGKQTIYQMITLAEEVMKRGGKPREPIEYKQHYMDLLMERIAHRREALRDGSADPEAMLVPGTTSLLRGLLNRGVSIYLASGTDECFVREEAELLKLTDYFGAQHIYGAIDDFKKFSKALVIDRILRENSVDGKHLLGFGDGYVEIDNTKCVGGTGIGVATEETEKNGKANAFKRERLLGVGADIIIPDFRDSSTLLKYLFAE
jgi:phosphoglycolate phosphatase-like HAD superfamily hydrolase